MNFENLINDFIPYGLPSLIIGVSVGVAFFVVNAFLSKNHAEIDAIYPLITGSAIFFAYFCLTCPKNDIFSESMTSANILCGSFSAAVYVFIKNLKGANAEDKNALNNLLSCYTDVKNARALSGKIKKIVKNTENLNELSENISSLLKSEGINSSAAVSVAEKIAEKEKNKDKL